MTATAARDERRHGDLPAAPPLWLRLVMPSVADLLFSATFLFMTIGIWASHLLWDTSTGWHIRSGERILRTLSIPRTDPFSYTMAGQPWYAWEWLWEAVNGGLHLAFGLSGVVVLTAFLIALTFALLYRTVAARTGNALLSAVLTIIAMGASSIHFLARPHVVSWLLTFLVLLELDALARGSRWPVWTLPLTFALWTNLHGGFVFGLALIALYGIAHSVERNYWLVRRLAAVFSVSVLATLLNPYGLKLHAHIVRYLASREQMNQIDEFLSPNFHDLQLQFFLLLLLFSVATVLLSRTVRCKELLLIVLAIASGLVAARNIPVACILLAYAAAPTLGEGLHGSCLQRLLTSGERMWHVETGLKGHLLPAVTVVAMIATLLSGHRLANATWYPPHVPTAAANYVVNQLGAHDHVFAPDYWGGYLIYSHAKDGFRVAVDDRSDLYGDARFRQYLEVASVRPGWRQVMNAWQIRYALLPVDSRVRSVLAAAPDWRQIYADKIAVVFVRTDVGAGK